MEHLYPLIVENEQKFGEYLALNFEGRNYANTELNSESRRLAAALSDLGARHGDRVLIHLPNCPEVWVTYLASCRLGTAVIPTMAVLTADDLKFLLTDSGAKVVLTNQELGPKVLSIRDQCPDLDNILVVDGALDGTTDYRRLLEATTNEIEGAAGDPEDLAALIYTSGTTGKPKGVMLTHKNFYTQAQISYDLYVAKGEDGRQNTMLMPLPLSHIYGLYVTVTTLLMGNTMVMMRRFEPQQALELIKEHQVRIAPAVPTMLINILAVAEAPSYCGSVVQWDCGGSPLPVEVLEQVQDKLGGVVTEGWGLSEATGPVANVTRDIVQKKGSVGPPMPGIEVRVVDASGVDVPVGQIGEFLARGDTLMKGYWNRPETTAEALADGWLHTGDMGYQDQDQYCYIVDRKDDLIIRGGENISPRDIEEVLYQHPGVQEAAAVGKPDPIYGQKVSAYVVLKAQGEASDTELKDFCRERLARFKVPEEILFAQDLPKNSLGKILKSELN